MKSTKQFISSIANCPGRRFRAFAGTALIAISGLFSPFTSETRAESESAPLYTVTASVAMIADIVDEVAGGRANVEGIIGSGVDPHLYKPTTPDIKLMQRADVIFYNGLNLEGKMGDVLIRVARSGKAVYAVTEEILDQGDYVITDEEDHYDPHVWMDVQGWIKAVEVVSSGLSDFDPDGAAIYQKNAADFTAELEKLDAYARESIASIPESKRVLVTAHDAFGYMARAYGLEVKGIQGISTESEAGVKDIEDLVSFLVDRQIPAIFVESSVSDKNIRALAEGAKAKGHEVSIGGELFSDAMGVSGTYEGTYIGMIDHNVTTITRALGGDAPERGLNGKLLPSH
ncbi:MAG: zinc ABC transporter substrate-binding protein [Verrucomicrobiales bacterium]|nr:zinc ABC transporter substrate-binding protein [Verrucomicrobiales bacterium]